MEEAERVPIQDNLPRWPEQKPVNLVDYRNLGNNSVSVGGKDHGKFPFKGETDNLIPIKRDLVPFLPKREVVTISDVEGRCSECLYQDIIKKIKCGDGNSEVGTSEDIGNIEIEKTCCHNDKRLKVKRDGAGVGTPEEEDVAVLIPETILESCPLEAQQIQLNNCIQPPKPEVLVNLGSYQVGVLGHHSADPRCCPDHMLCCRATEVPIPVPVPVCVTPGLHPGPCYQPTGRCGHLFSGQRGNEDPPNIYRHANVEPLTQSTVAANYRQEGGVGKLQAVREKNKVYQAKRRRQMTEAQLAALRERNRQYQARRRHTLMSDQANYEYLCIVRERNRLYQARRRQNMSLDELKAQREKNRLIQKRRRQSMSEEQLAMEREKNRIRQSLRRCRTLSGGLVSDHETESQFEALLNISTDRNDPQPQSDNVPNYQGSVLIN